MKKKSKGMIVFFTVLLFVAMAVSNFGNYQLSAIPSRIYEAYSLTDVQYSSIMTGPLLPPIFLSIILGLLVDKFGISRVVSICLFIAMGGYIIRLFANNYATMLIAMILTGFAGTALTGNLSKIVDNVYPPEKISLMVGIFMAASTGSTAIAYATTARISSLTVISLIALAPAVFSAVFWFLFIKEDFFSSSSAQTETIPVAESLRICLRNPYVWLTGFSLAFVMGGANIVTNFHVAALSALKGYSETYAGSFETVLMIGSLVGSILMPIAVSKAGKFAAALAGILTLIVGITTPLLISLPAGGIYVASFVNGALRSGTLSVGFALPVMFREIGPKYAGTAGGLVLTLDLFGGVVIPTYIIVPLAGSGNFTTFFSMSAVCSVVSAILMFIVIQRSRVFEEPQHQAE